MQGWMIALIVIACVVLFVTLAAFITVIAVFKKVLGRPTKPLKGEFPEKYGVELGWFDEVKSATKELYITAYDGIKLGALLLQHADKPDRVAILQHGYYATPYAMQPYAKLLYDKGYDVLMPAARGHDISGGSYIGMGWVDRFDILRWTAKAVELYGDDVRICLMGISMGGAAVIGAAGTGLPKQVKCVVDDCGFSSQLDEYTACVTARKLPRALSLFVIDAGVRMFCGFSIYEADIVPLAKKMTVPALFIHGDKDTFVPPELGQKLYDACASAKKRQYIAEGAVHAAAYVTDKEKYAEELLGFVEEHIS